MPDALPEGYCCESKAFSLLSCVRNFALAAFVSSALPLGCVPSKADLFLKLIWEMLFFTVAFVPCASCWSSDYHPSGLVGTTFRSRRFLIDAVEEEMRLLELSRLC